MNDLVFDHLVTFCVNYLLHMQQATFDIAWEHLPDTCEFITRSAEL